MSDLVRTTLLGLFFGTFGTTIGGIIGVKLKRQSNKFLSFILSFASGLMLAIVCFDLIPEALEISNVLLAILGIVLGISCMIICEIIIDDKFRGNNELIVAQKGINTKKQNSIGSKQASINNEKANLLKTGIITSIGLALHNFPEGLAIGSGFGASATLGYSLALAICIHDVPEGISMAIPMKNGGMKPGRVIFYVVLSGITTGVGAFFGKIIGEISEKIIAMCLAFAAGAMLYIVSGELIPESNRLYSGRIGTIGNIIGFLLGLIAMSI